MMTPAGMSAAIKSQIQSVFDIVDETRLQEFSDAMGEAIVTYIQANAVVPAGIALQAGPYTGSTTGTGTVT